MIDQEREGTILWTLVVVCLSLAILHFLFA